MRVTKLVVGILLNVLAAWLFLDGLLFGLFGLEGSQNVLLAIMKIIMSGLFIGSGVTYICLEKSSGLGSDITGFVLLLIGGIIGILGGFFDYWMYIYAAISLFVGIGFFIWHIKKRKADRENHPNNVI